MGSKPMATNKKAYHNYFLSQKWECGIALVGSEVKSIREGQVNFKDTFARVEKGEVILYNLHINPYKQASYMNLDPDRPRRLLLHKKEIRKMEIQINEKGGTLIPTKIYINSRGLVKVELAVGKGKRQYDKREDKKKQTIEKALKRTLGVVRKSR